MDDTDSTGKIARIIIEQIREDSGIDLAVTSRSIDFIISVLEQAQQQGLEQAANYVESLAVIDTSVASDQMIGIANIFKHIALSIRGLLNND